MSNNYSAVVIVTRPATGATSGSSQDRRITTEAKESGKTETVAKIEVRASSLEKLRERLAQHVSLTEED